MSEIPPIAPQPPLSGVRRIDGEKPRQQQKQTPAKQPNKPDSSNHDDGDQSNPPHIDEIV